VTHFRDEAAWRQAAERGLADPILSALPAGYHTPLGKWNRGGQELSGGQWQKVALSRAYMRPDASVLVLDEPSSALDPEAESRLFDQVREATRGDDATQMVILVSHRFGTVRSADRIVVLDQGRIAEQGTHESLMAEGGRYQRLFQLQAAGFAETLPARGPREPDEAPAAEG
jgi:ABC-type multidrug transport system fused ATPase/permease subunit